MLVRYGAVPSDCLWSYIACLCRTVNIDAFCQRSWQIVRNLLKSATGHNSLLVLCEIMERSAAEGLVNAVRGGIFFAGAVHGPGGVGV